MSPIRGGLIVCQTLFEDDFLISGDFKGKVKAKSTDRLDQGELRVDDDNGEFSISELLKNLQQGRYVYEGITLPFWS